MPDAVVLGGNGFIGRRLVNLLVEQGKSVRIVSRSASGGAGADSPIEYRSGSVSSAEDMSAAIESASSVYYLATGGGQRWAEFERDFVHAARNVAEACKLHQVRRLVYTSSTAALYLGANRVVDESTPADPKPHTRSFYSRGKIEAENVLLASHRDDGLPLVIARPGVVLGPGGMLNHSGFGLWCSDLECIGWGMGRNPLPLVLADDVAQALSATGEVTGIDGRAFNLACNVQITAREFVSEMEKRSMRRYRFHSRSLWWEQSIEIFKWMAKVAARRAENPYPYYRDLKSRSFRSRLDCSAARDVLGWKPVDDRDEFLRQSIDSNLPKIPAGDLRLRPALLS